MCPRGGESVTDLISQHDTGVTETTASDEALPSRDEQPTEWDSTEPAPKKKQLGLWFGIGAGAIALAAVGASLILIAPGTTVAGVPVGWMTPGMATEAISNRLAAMEVELTGVGATLSGADLGARVDAGALAEHAFADRPMWNLGSWMGDPINTKVTLDPTTADHVLRGVAPSSYVEPVDAVVSFDEASQTYLFSPAKSGTGISVPDLETAFTAAFNKGETAFSVSEGVAEVPPAITDAKAEKTSEELNGMLTKIGFYVGDERVVAVAPDVAANWLRIENVDGELKITADQSAIQSMVATLPDLVNRDSVNALTVVDSKGKVLRTLVEGKEARTLGDTAGIASAFATALSDGKASFELPVSTVPFETKTLYRRIEVDISEQRTYLFENDKRVDSLPTSTGLSNTPTPVGRFRVFGHTAKQNMGCGENSSYCTKDVPWSTWFAPNIAFHGAYWHNNFGHRMSHGCVNLPPQMAKRVYDWSPQGLEVWVHD